MKSHFEIQKMFDEIAPKYDFMNNIISFGTHKIIKSLAVKKIRLQNNSKALDLCCGTGDIANLIAKRKDVESVVGVDFSDKMLEMAKKKNSHLKIEYIKADCTKLPFEDNSFDVITMFFGLRNIEDKDAVLKEIKRVLKQDGQFVHMDFGCGNFLANFIFEKFTPVLAKFFSNNAESYKYLTASKKEFFMPSELTKYMADKDFTRHSEYNFLFSVINVQIFV